MTKVIFDTSSLVRFIDFSYRFDYSKLEEPPRLFERMFPVLEIVENAIEAFILYDDIYIDESSLRSTGFVEDYNRLEELDNCHFLKLDEQQAESIYQKIFSKLNLDVNIVSSILSMSESEHNMFTDAHNNFSLYGTEYFYPDYYPYCYYGKCLENFKTRLKCMDRFQKSSNEGIDIDLPFYHIVRYLYYIELQQLHSSELVLHPNRNYLVQFFSGYKRLYTNKIVEKYEPLRIKLHKRESEWLGTGDNSLLIPMVASYVLSRCKQQEDLFKVINEVRNSKAQLFRKGLSELVTIIAQHNQGEIDEILVSLEEARMRWDKKLKNHPTMRTKCISLSIPVIGGLGMDVDIPYSMGNEVTSKLLTFIHKMLLNK